MLLTDTPAGFTTGLLRLDLPPGTGDPVEDAIIWVERHAEAFGVLNPGAELKFDRAKASACRATQKCDFGWTARRGSGNRLWENRGAGGRWPPTDP